MKRKNVFFTGPPRCGKSTLIEIIVQKLSKPTTGFFTREIKEEGQRSGFSITTLDGKKGILAHKRLKSRYRVGKYGVNLEDIDRILVPSMYPKNESEIIVVDEVGKMECFSALFRKKLVQILDSDNIVIGSISLKGDRFMQTIKSRRDVEIIYVTHDNRNELAKMKFGQ